MASAIDPSLFLDPTTTTIILKSQDGNSAVSSISTRSNSRDAFARSSRKYIVHKALVCAYFGYFRAAYKTNLREATENEFVLTDVDEAAFERLVKWLYTGEVYLEEGAEAFDPVFYVGEQEGTAEDDDHKDHDVDDVDFDEEAADTAEQELFAAQLHEPGEDELLERAIYVAWPHTKPSDLDALQIRYCLLCDDWQHQSQQETGDPLLPEARLKLETMLLEKEAEEATQNIDSAMNLEQDPRTAYDDLIALYILADRFDSPALRTQLINLLHAEYLHQLSHLGGTPLPSFRTVTHAYSNLPTTSMLRRWLVAVYSVNWLPASDSAADKVGRQDLPHDFLMDLLVKNSNAVFWARGEGDMQLDRSLCQFHEHETEDETLECWYVEENGKDNDQGKKRVFDI